MKLSDKNQKTLMLAIHKKIEEYADSIAEKLKTGETADLLTYPPNCGLTDNETQALEKLKNDHDLKSALRKILADNSAGVIFDMMNYLDGTADPEENLDNWTEVAFVDKTDDIEPPDDMLHDNFFQLIGIGKKSDQIQIGPLTCLKKNKKHMGTTPNKRKSALFPLRLLFMISPTVPFLKEYPNSNIKQI